MILLFFTSGLLLSMVGALPPGAANLAVVKASLNGQAHRSQQLSFGAGFGEVILAFVALIFGMLVQDFIGMHLWIQWLMVLIFMVVGVFFLRFRSSETKKQTAPSSQYLTGFLLSLINPPVLLYWVIVIALVQPFFTINSSSSTHLLLLFFFGVFLGKVSALLGYTKLAGRWGKTAKTQPDKTNRIVGLLLLGIAGLQMIKLVLF